MFNPRGNVPPRPRGPNTHGPIPRGSFQESGPGHGGLQRQPPPSPHQMLRFMGSDMRAGFPGPSVQVTQHRTDPRQPREKINMERQQKDEGRTTCWDNPFPPGNSGRSQPASGRIVEQATGVQSRYTNESASSILASFGLSNEDLEELSRYPDDQLTPENMPLILRDIRMRKMTHQLPSLPSQSREKESFRSDDSRGTMVKSKVIDYGHESKYGYTEGPLDVKVYGSDVQSEESMERFQGQQTASVTAAPSSIPNNPLNAVEELIRRMGFQRSTPTTQSFFPMDTANERSGLCLPSAAPGMPPAAQPILPPVVPSVPQPVMPPVVQQTLPPPPVAQPIMPSMNQPPPPYAPEILETVKRHDRLQQESRGNRPNAPPGSTSGQKNFQKGGGDPIASPFGVVKASWLPAFSQADAQKMKRLPTPSMMNDYYAASPRIFPHMCSLCNLECHHLKDWIQHQNTTAHIESCRQLRQQYPDWNPESHSSSKRREDRKENRTLRRRSCSPNPKRLRRSNSRHGRRRSRSRSRSPGHRRARSRSPRCLGPIPRSRSLRRSHNRIPHSQRSSSRERGLGRSTRSPGSATVRTSELKTPSMVQKGDTLEAAVKCSGPRFAEQFNKQKSLQELSQGASRTKRTLPEPGKTLGSTKNTPSDCTTPLKTPKRELPSHCGSSDVKMKPPEVADVSNKGGGVMAAGTNKALPLGEAAKDATVASPLPYNRLLTDKLLSCGTVLRISDLPDDGFSDHDIKKIVQPFGKVSDVLVLRSRNEAFLEMNYKEAVTAAVKYGNTVPVVVNGRRVKISVAEKPKAPLSQNKGNVKKTVQNVKKTPNTKKDQTSSAAKTARPVAPVTPTSKTSVKKSGEPQKSTMTKTAREQKKPANVKKSGVAKEAVDPKKPVDPKKSGATKAAAGEQKKPADAKKSEEATKAVETKKIIETKKAVEPKGEETCTPAHVPDVAEAVKSSEAVDLVKEAEDVCVVVISNLPETGLSLEEISNLTKPFGGLKDMLLVSSHKKVFKAYLEISSKSADAMVKFYTCFPMWVESNQLCITKAPEFKNIRDEEAIFTTMIQDGNPKVNTETLHAQFVHLGNLPDSGYSELEILCVGLRFGRVDRYMVITNKNRAILQLDTPESAASMCRFLKRYPYNLGERQLTFSRSPKIEPPTAEVVKREVRKQEPSKESPDLKKNPEGSGVVHPTAGPSVKPLEVKEEPSSNVKTKFPEVKTKLPEVKTKLPEVKTEDSGTETAVCEAAVKPSKTEASEGVPVHLQGLDSAIVPADLGTLEVKSEAAFPSPYNLKKEEKAVEFKSNELLENTSISAAGNGSQELCTPAGKPSEELHSVAKAESLGAASAITAEGKGEPVLLDSAEAPVEEPSDDDLQSSNKQINPGAYSNVVSASVAEVPAAKVGVATDKEDKSPLSIAKVDLKVGSQATEVEMREVTKEKTELQAVEVGAAEEKPSKELVLDDGAAKEKKLDKDAKQENPEPILPKEQTNEAPDQGQMEESRKASRLGAEWAPGPEATSASKSILKALMSVPNISKATASAQKEEPKPALKVGTRSQAAAEKKVVAKEASRPRVAKKKARVPVSVVSKVNTSPLVKVGSEKSSSELDKNSKAEPKGGSKQPRERESRSSSRKPDDDSMNKASTGRNTRSSKSITKPKEEVELFPFNLDEFVTVDEVIDEVESPPQPKRNPLKGKRKDFGKKNSSDEPSTKRIKGKSSANSAAVSKLSFVTLDEIGEDDGGMTQTAEDLNFDAMPDPQVLVTVDEVNDEEEPISEVAKDPHSLVTLDEISEQEETLYEAAGDVLSLGDNEPDLKSEPLVTVDEIGEVEELPLNEPSHFSLDETLKSTDDGMQVVEDPGEVLSSQLPDDPSMLVTVDEIHEDTDDQPLVTLDEVMEDDEDFLAEFNSLKENFNFVTVDEVGSEEDDDNTFTGSHVDESVGETVSQKGIMPVAEPEGVLVSSAEPELVLEPSAEPSANPEGVLVSSAKPEERVALSAKPEEDTLPSAEPEGVLMPSAETEEGIVSSAIETEESVVPSVETEEGIVPSAEPEETGIDIPPEEKGNAGDELPKGNEKSVVQTEATENESFVAELDRQEFSLNAEKDEGKDLEKTRKLMTEPNTGCEQPLAESEDHEEDVVAEATGMGAEGGSRSTGDEAPVAAPDATVSTVDSQTAVTGELTIESDLPGQDLKINPGTDLEEESCSEATPSQSSEKPEKHLTELEREEPESKQRKVDSPEKSKTTTSHLRDLDFLVPKAGYFCQICSCFCVDEASMKTHCQSETHQQNMKKFMVKTAQEEEKKEAEGNAEELGPR